MPLSWRNKRAGDLPISVPAWLVAPVPCPQQPPAGATHLSRDELVAFHTRHRDKNGEITHKNGNTLTRTCESRSIDFFEKQATQCRAQAKRASNKADRESWLDMALRWEGNVAANRGEYRQAAEAWTTELRNPVKVL